MSCRVGSSTVLNKDAAFIFRAAHNIYFEADVVNK